jgi:hypothetical protein
MADSTDTTVVQNNTAVVDEHLLAGNAMQLHLLQQPNHNEHQCLACYTTPACGCKPLML